MLAGHPVPEQEACALPSNPAPTVRKPILAYVICGAVLLVPLALSAPQRAPGGTEVVLATGSDEAAVTAEAAGPAVDFAEAEIDAGAEVDADLEADVDVGHGPSAHDQGEGGPPQPTSRRSGARSTPTSKRSGVSGTAKATATATATGTATTPRPAASAPTPAPAKASAPAPSPDPPPPPPPPPSPPPPPPPAPTAASSAWDRLAQCESGNTNDHGAPYYGYWQFSAATWHSVGETGLPDEYSRQHQLAAAMRLHAVRGWAPWPDCARRLGLT